MKKYKEIIIKNIIIHLLLVLFYIFAREEIFTIPKEKLDTLVLFVGLIVIAPITANFIYTYRGVKNAFALKFGHLTTFFSTVVIGMLFIILDILLIQMIGSIITFRVSILMFWIGVILFDFADFASDKDE